MTNEEFIALLQKLPPDADVYMKAYDCEGSLMLASPFPEDITIDKDGDIIIEL